MLKHYNVLQHNAGLLLHFLCVCFVGYCPCIVCVLCLHASRFYFSVDMQNWMCFIKVFKNKTLTPLRPKMPFGGDISWYTYVIYMNGNLGIGGNSLKLHGWTLTSLPRKQATKQGLMNAADAKAQRMAKKDVTYILLGRSAVKLYKL